MQPGDRVAYVQRVGYGVEYLLGTVTDVMPACGGRQLQDEVSVRLDDGRRCGGPVGLFIRWGK